ncbi:MAG: hypothetical protein AAF368_11900 [Planctomycetota bacterium]
MSAKASGDSGAWSSETVVEAPPKKFPWVIFLPVGCFVLLVFSGLVTTLVIPSFIEGFLEGVTMSAELVPGDQVTEEQVERREREFGVQFEREGEGEELLWCFLSDDGDAGDFGFLSTKRVAFSEGGFADIRELVDVTQIWFELEGYGPLGSLLFIETGEEDDLTLFFDSEEARAKLLLDDLDRLCSELAGESYRGLRSLEEAEWPPEEDAEEDAEEER